MMKNKNGFISISVVYSFFVVFMLLLVLIINSYVNNRASFDIFKEHIKHTMAGKYSATNNTRLLYNEIINNANIYTRIAWDERNWYIEKFGTSGEEYYYFRGYNPKNFVCIPPKDKKNCDDDKEGLYRIIGAFKAKSLTDESSLQNQYLVKLVKYNPYGNSIMHNDIYNTLNTYITEMNASGAGSMIVPVKQTRYPGTDISGKFFADMLSSENSNRQEEVRPAGLLTISDIGYTTGNFFNCIVTPEEGSSVLSINAFANPIPQPQLNSSNIAYIYSKDYGWNISEQWLYNSDDYSAYNNGFKINNDGKIELDMSSETTLSIRPVIYLKPNVSIVKGTGTIIDPYLLNTNITEVASE